LDKKGRYPVKMAPGDKKYAPYLLHQPSE